MSVTSTPTKAGIVKLTSGERCVPSSIRPDGTRRKEIKIRPGFEPKEDVEIYKIRHSETWRRRRNGEIPCVRDISEEKPPTVLSESKSSKRRNARMKTKENKDEVKGDSIKVEEYKVMKCDIEERANFEAKKGNLAEGPEQRLKQVRKSKEKFHSSTTILPEALIKIDKLVRELKAMEVGCNKLRT